MLATLRRLDREALDGTSRLGQSQQRLILGLVLAVVGAVLGLMTGIPLSLVLFDGDPRSLVLVYLCPLAGAALALALIGVHWRRSRAPATEQVAQDGRP